MGGRLPGAGRSAGLVVVIPGIGWPRCALWLGGRRGTRAWRRSGACGVGRRSIGIGFEYRAAFVGKLRRVRAQARDNAIDIRDLIAAQPPHIGRAGHLLFPGSAIFLRPRRGGGDRECASKRYSQHSHAGSFQFQSGAHVPAAHPHQACQMNEAAEGSLGQLNVILYSTLPIFFTAAISRALSSATNFENSGASR